jgi:hypothetical protein
VTGDRLDRKRYFQKQVRTNDHAATVQPMVTKSNILSVVAAQRQHFSAPSNRPRWMPATSTQNQHEGRKKSASSKPKPPGEKKAA